MPISYKAVKRSVPVRSGGSDSKYFVSVDSRKKMTSRQIEQCISLNTSVGIEETRIVLNKLNEIVTEHLQDGEIIEVLGLGNMYLNILCNPVEKYEDVSLSCIKGLKLYFNPTKGLKEKIEKCKYKKAY